MFCHLNLDPRLFKILLSFLVARIMISPLSSEINAYEKVTFAFKNINSQVIKKLEIWKHSIIKTEGETGEAGGGWQTKLPRTSLTHHEKFSILSICSLETPIPYLKSSKSNNYKKQSLYVKSFKKHHQYRRNKHLRMKERRDRGYVCVCLFSSGWSLQLISALYLFRGCWFGFFIY